ncbi:hypothetical protein [Winogradskyella sp. R77965]|uniref:hypothetical protein n=1 Tax=Winogradskyella sp. R77965 TaxID=3093872 RepID=UPI0037DC3B28
MKNLFFTLAFLLVSSLSFATNTFERNITSEVKSEVKIIDTVNAVDVILIGEMDEFKQCHVTIKGTINGQEVDLDITFTSDSGSCIKDTIALLKELAEE